MVDLTALGGALASLNHAKNLAQAMIGLRDSQAFQEKAIEFQSKILDAQSSLLAANEERAALIAEISELKEEMARLETWNTEKQRYELQQVDPGAFAYVLKPNAGVSEPPHWLCASCYQRNKKSLLQAHGRDTTESFEIYKCPDCSAAIRVHYNVGPHSPGLGARPKPKAPVNPALACPKCGEQMKVSDESSHPMFGEMGLKIHQVECACGNRGARDYHPGKGYV